MNIRRFKGKKYLHFDKLMFFALIGLKNVSLNEVQEDKAFGQFIHKAVWLEKKNYDSV